MKDAFFAVVNPVAGHRKCGKLARPTLQKLQAAGLELEVVETRFAGHGIEKEGRKGDLLVEIAITVPETLNEAQEKAMRDFAEAGELKF